MLIAAILSASVLVPTLRAQQFEIRGVVRDSSGMPLGSAAVSIEGTGKATSATRRCRHCARLRPTRSASVMGTTIILNPDSSNTEAKELQADVGSEKFLALRSAQLSRLRTEPRSRRQQGIRV